MKLIPTIALCISVLLSACGFQPIYKASNNNYNISTSSNISGREGQIFKNSLSDNFTLKSQAKYNLNADFTINDAPLIINPNGTIQRHRTLISSNFILTNIKSGKIIKRGNINKAVSYNESDNDYSTYISSKDVIKRGLQELAKDYAVRISAILGIIENSQ